MMLKNSRLFLYLSTFIALLPLVIFNYYGFYLELDIYGKIDGLMFCTYYFVSLLVIARAPSFIYSSYVLISFLIIFSISKASSEYYLFYDSYISFDHLTLFKEFLLALKNFSTPWTFLIIIAFTATMACLHVFFIKSLRKSSILSSTAIAIICILITLPFYNFHKNRYHVADLMNLTEKPTYEYSFENPIMFFFRSLPWNESEAVYKKNAKRATLAKALEKKTITILPDIYSPKNYDSLLLDYPDYESVNVHLKPLENTPKKLSEVLIQNTKNKKNVLIVVLESFRSYEFENSKLIGINLEKIAAKSIVFNEAYSIARATIKSEQAILCSTLDTNLKTTYSVKQGKYAGQCLPKILKNHGYDTSWFHGNTKDFYNRRTFHPTLGFDNIYSKEEIQKIKGNKVNDIGWGMPDPTIYKFALNKLKNKKGPFFAEILTVSSHQPFNWDYGEFKFPNTFNSESDDIYKNYLKALYYADHALGQFWNEFMSSPLKDNTIVVFTGDHGVPFYPEQEISETDKFDILFKVPLMIYHPDIAPSRNFFQSSHMDITPTLLSLLDISVQNSFIGRATLGGNKTLTKRPIYHVNMNNYGFRFGKTKCVPKMAQCIDKNLCYKDERFMCDLEKKSDILQIQQSDDFMEYMILLTEAHYAN